MSRATVRAAVAAYLQPPAVDGLNVMLTAKPRDLAGHLYTDNQPPGTTSGAIGMVTIEEQHETPMFTDGAGGGRLTEYIVGVQVFHMSVEELAETAMDQFDAVIDALCKRLRADPTLGLGQQSTIGPNGTVLSGAYESLAVQFGEPESANEDGTGSIETWAIVRFPVKEANRET